jgi:serine/threonine protein kinase
VSQLHAVGWVWGDCKPSNLILTDKSELRTFDFESAHPAYEATRSNWITPGFVPLHVPRKERSALATDLYAVGVVIFFLLVGSMPTAAVTAKKMGQLRPHVPLRVREIVCSLLNATEKGPDAQSLTDELLNIQLSL